jgi:uncharacterized membrane protein
MARAPAEPAVSGGNQIEIGIRPSDVARDIAPVAVTSGMVGVSVLAFRRTNPSAALKIARFFNLLLASLLTGNGVGSERFVHPALRSLSPRVYLEAEQAITRRYPGTMLALMPAAIASGFSVLALMPRRDRSFWLTLAGTLGLVGVQATTLIELPLNQKTLHASQNDPDSWLRERPRWDRFNRLRTLFEVASWSLLCLAALSDRRGEVSG